VQDLDPVVLFESGCHQSESLVGDVRTSSQSSCAPVNCHFTRGMSDLGNEALCAVKGVNQFSSTLPIQPANQGP